MLKSKAAMAFIFFLTLQSSLLAQERAIPYLSATKPVFSHQFFFLDQSNFYFIDTSFNSLYTYHQWNAAMEDLYYYAPLSNMGAPQNRLSLPVTRSTWLPASAKAYSPYFLHKDEIPFYTVRSPLTEAQYWMGYENGQTFRIYHTQNISKHWNFLLSYKRTNVLGQYEYSQNKLSSFMFNTHYRNSASPYEAYSYFTGEKLTTQENGGIVDIEGFLQNKETSRILYDVNLPRLSETRDGRIMRYRQFYLDHKVKLNYFFNSENDSLKPVTKERNYIALGHESKYDRISDTYIGNSEDFYPNYYFTDGVYRDSNQFSGFSNALYLQTKFGDSTLLDVKGGIKHLFTQYGGEGYQFISNNLGLSGQLKGRIKERVEVKADADYIFSGALAQTFNLTTSAKWEIWRKLTLFGDYQINRSFPDFYTQYYISNNYIWENDFKPELRNIISYGIGWQNINYLKITHFASSNFTYLDENALPQQADLPVNALKVELNQNFSFWKFLHLDNRITYQTTTDAENALPLPELISRNALYFEFSLFNKALNCLIGGEVKYFSPYYSPSYNPALGSFYNLEDRIIGGYPLIDAFANFEIKKAQIFVKMENVAQGWPDYNYFAAPNYPLPDRTLRVGIRWRFFN